MPHAATTMQGHNNNSPAWLQSGARNDFFLGVGGGGTKMLICLVICLVIYANM